MNSGWDERVANIFCGVLFFVVLIAVLVIGLYGG